VAELYQSMTLGEYLPNSNTKLLLHLNGSSADSSGNNNNGTDTAITYSQANGKFGQGAGFNGTTSLIYIPSNLGIAGNGDITMSGWFKLNTEPTSGQVQIFMETASNLTATRYFQIYYTNNGGTIYFNLDSSAPAVPLLYNITLGITNWYHIAVSRNSTTAFLYINGVLVLQGAIGTYASYSANEFNIGSALADDLKANVDEVIVENRVWTPQQVQKYYTNSKGRFGIV